MKYRLFAEKSLGNKYKEKGWVCQDAVYKGDKYEEKNFQAITVADGHGSRDAFRSEYGSKFATEEATNYSYIHCGRSTGYNPDKQNDFNETGIANLKFTICEMWKKKVKSHWDEQLREYRELSDREIRYQSVTDKYKTRFSNPDKSVVEKYLYYAYGTTLLVAISTSTQLLLLQIGDGTCVVLQRDGEFRTPIPTDDSSFLNVTTSICEENAHLKIRHAVIDRDFDSPTFPIAVFLSTDGVDDCFPIHKNEEYLFKLYTNVIDSILRIGFEKTFAELKDETLPGLSASGSQDDIALAILVYDDIEILRQVFGNIDEEFTSTQPDKSE
jgi:serine/threonine protein phosphatase PrpC